MDDEESNIKKARPKQGLETGGLISGKERVAQAYAKSLSGAEGPVAQFDAVDEIARLQVQQAFDRMTFSSPAGSPAIFGRNGHYAIAAPRARGGNIRRDSPSVRLFIPGFWVSVVGSNEVYIQPSVVSGMSGSSVVPEGVGEPFSMSLTVGRVVALRVEADPTVQNIGTVDEPNYVIVDGGGTLVGDVETATFSSLSAMNTASEIALIDNSDGGVTQSGVYYLPLAMVLSAGVLTQVGHVGPIGIRMCSAGSIIVNSPALQIVAVDANGNIVNPGGGG